MADDKELERTEEEELDTPAETPSLEEQISELLADNKRLKRAVDKASSQAADYKKRLSEKLSEAEKLADEQAERDAKLAEYEKRDLIRDAADDFMSLGYSKELAYKAAEAHLNGDTKELASIQKDFLAEKEKTFRDALMKGMAPPQPGGEKNSEAALTMEEFNLHKKDPNWINANWDKVQELLRNLPKQ